jgi:hypothetical protein
MREEDVERLMVKEFVAGYSETEESIDETNRIEGLESDNAVIPVPDGSERYMIMYSLIPSRKPMVNINSVQDPNKLTLATYILDFGNMVKGRGNNRKRSFQIYNWGFTPGINW